MQSSTRKHRAVGFCLGWLASLAIAGPALAGSDAVFVGWQDLLDRIGLAELPTGAGVVVAQVDPKEFEPLPLTTLTLVDERKYGNTLLVFYERPGT